MAVKRIRCLYEIELLDKRYRSSKIVLEAESTANIPSLLDVPSKVGEMCSDQIDKLFEVEQRPEPEPPKKPAKKKAN